MISISGTIIDSGVIKGQYMTDYIESKIINLLLSSDEVNNFDSMNQLVFEVTLRRSIINAAVELDKSELSFGKKAKCNPNYWELIEIGGLGGFLLKNGVKPSDAIRDIYIHSSEYVTECANAMLIVYYKALVDILPEEFFNELFANLILIDWEADKDLGIHDTQEPVIYLPGDCRYFKNPDVDPNHEEWQGENTIDLGDGTFYGLGIGIASAKKIIGILNSYRKSGSQVSAYLMTFARRPDFKSLSNKYFNYFTRSKFYQPISIYSGNSGLTPVLPYSYSGFLYTPWCQDYRNPRCPN